MAAEEPEVPTVVFMVGRMNPPTPGHVEIAQRVLKIAEKKSAIPRIYLTRSQNNPNKLEGMVKYVTSDENDRLPKRSRDGTVKGGPGPVFVKHKEVQNPLTPDQKKEFLIDMLVFKKKQEDKDDFDADDYKSRLDDVVNINNDCVGRGPYSAFSCAAKLLQKGMEERRGGEYSTHIDVSKLIYVMGGEVDPAEAENREKNCGCFIDEDDQVEKCLGKLDWDTRKFPCKIIPRAEDSKQKPAEDEDEGAPAEDAEEDQFIINVQSMSGSKVRLMAACNPIYREEQLAKFQQVYKDYLEPERIQKLYDAILGGIICTRNPGEANEDEPLTGPGETEQARPTKTQKTKGGRKKRKTLKKKKHGKKIIGSKKGKRKGKRKTKRLRKGKKLLKPGVRKRHSTRRKR